MLVFHVDRLSRHALEAVGPGTRETVQAPLALPWMLASHVVARGQGVGESRVALAELTMEGPEGRQESSVRCRHGESLEPLAGATGPVAGWPH